MFTRKATFNLCPLYNEIQGENREKTREKRNKTGRKQEKKGEKFTSNDNQSNKKKSEATGREVYKEGYL